MYHNHKRAITVQANQLPTHPTEPGVRLYETGAIDRDAGQRPTFYLGQLRLFVILYICIHIYG